jgi:hypothetical protein
VAGGLLADVDALGLRAAAREEQRVGEVVVDDDVGGFQ